MDTYKPMDKLQINIKAIIFLCKQMQYDKLDIHMPKILLTDCQYHKRIVHHLTEDFTYFNQN